MLRAESPQRQIRAFLITTMQQSHKNAFFAAAQQFTCWIGLREPNVLSEKWIGRPGHVPKGAACKAKTADNPGHRFSGLVMDPVLCPDAFIGTSLSDALKKWKNDFARGGNLPLGFSRAESGPEKGLVKEKGSAIYADFDLMAINKSNPEGEFLFTDLPEQRALFAKVEPMLNGALGAKLIQHGAEFMWDEKIGARTRENVIWFGPGRRMLIGESSIQDKPICPQCNVWHEGARCPHMLLH